LIYLYTEKQNSPDWILKNDFYFDLYTGNFPLTEQDKEAIFRIDSARVTEDKHIETKYGLGTLRNLSSGCKTYLNIIKNPDKIVSVKECGGKVLYLFFLFDGVYIFFDYPERVHISENVKILFNDTEIAVGRSGYEAWWTKEYKRREDDDLQEY